MSRAEFSVIIVPDDTGKVIEKRISKWKVKVLLVALCVFFICSAFFAYGYIKSDIDQYRLVSLEDENQYLESELANVRESVELMKGQIANVIRKDDNIRLSFDLPIIDPSIREVGIGGPDFSSVEFNSPAAKNLSLLEKDINKISRQIDFENVSFDDVYEKIKGKKDVLDHTPSIMPTNGYITSGMGVRKDPFTGLLTMHKGIDIGARKGTHVYAPADGVILKCGWDKGMGNFIIIDHGYNLKTYYGHLEIIKVRNGQHVNRMDLIGNIGSTGRSTGPHLHYEVRKYGRPINPKDFFVKSIIFKS
ncbi:MAG: M23 family metallopeptidase [candidate division Zixibacteria bacterium]|nr:M23 family metallopeptidase [candidate division Zixibacteria bacterium]